jgi:hypothetical protein
MLGRSDDSSKNFSKRSTRSLHKSLADSQAGSITNRKAQSEIDYRKERNANIWKLIGASLTVVIIIVGFANYFKG